LRSVLNIYDSLGKASMVNYEETKEQVASVEKRLEIFRKALQTLKKLMT